MTEAVDLPSAPDGVPARLPDRAGKGKRGPNTPEGKARSRMNALKHGLRAREFGLLPEEASAEWQRQLDQVVALVQAVVQRHAQRVVAVAQANAQLGRLAAGLRAK